jgi:hypothetical protein
LTKMSTNDYKRLHRAAINLTLGCWDLCCGELTFSSSGAHAGRSIILRFYFTRQSPPCKPGYRQCCKFWLNSLAPRRARVHVQTSAKMWCSGWAGIQRVAQPAQTPGTSQHGCWSTTVWWTCREYHRRQARWHCSIAADGETQCPRREPHRPDLSAEDVPKGFYKDTLRLEQEPSVA